MVDKCPAFPLEEQHLLRMGAPCGHHCALAGTFSFPLAPVQNSCVLPSHQPWEGVKEN